MAPAARHAGRNARENAGCKAAEIEPGRPVQDDWERALVEPWAQRKARRAAEKRAS